MNTRNKNPSESNSDEITVFVRIGSKECNELFDWFSSKDIKAKKSFGIQNNIIHAADPTHLIEIAKQGTPYLMVWGFGGAIAKALNAYAATHKRKLKIRRTLTEIEIEAENISPEDLTELATSFGLIDMTPTENDPPPPENPNKEQEMGFHVGKGDEGKSPN
jgi:hypothetical protein